MAKRRGLPARLPVRRVAILFATLLFAVLVWLAGLIWFVGNIPRERPSGQDPALSVRTDAIVVLTGGSERLTAGLDLLTAGLAHKLFVSGVYHSVDVRELLRLSRQKPGELECCIVLGYTADNTMGNAAETADWMQEEHYSSLRLVTANYHMQRSLLEFRMALPTIQVIPHPVATPNVRLDEWWLRRGTANLIVNEYNKYLIALLRYGLVIALDWHGQS